jgi:hypothetical protein
VLLAAVALLATSAAACDLLKKGDAAPDAGAAPSATAAVSVAASASSKPKAMPASGITPPPATPLAGTPDFAALLGTKADGWNPKVFGTLKAGMSPADAGKAFKYSNAYDANGIADVPVGNVKGVQRYRFTYLEGKLKFGEIWFSAETPALRDALVNACKAKWGNPEKGKVGDDVMWIGPDFNSVTVGKVIDLTAKGYNLTVALK